MAFPDTTRATPTIVIDNDITWVTDERGGLWGTKGAATPPEALKREKADLAVLLARWADVARRADSSDLMGITVLLAEANIRALGWPAKAPANLDEAKTHPALDRARNVGWRTDRLQPWMTFHRNGSPAVHVGVLPWLDSQTFELVDPDPVTVAYRTQWMQAALGAAYRARPGVTAIAGLKRMIPGKTPFFKPEWTRVEPVGPYDENRMRWEAPYIWDSPSVELLQLDHTVLHGWDIKGCFLAAASMAELGRDALRHTKKTEFDGAAGYWKVVVPPWNFSSVLPHPAGNLYSAGDVVWMTSPRVRLLLKLANEYGVMSEPEIIDSWTSPDKPARILRPWAERIRDLVTLAELEPDKVDREVLGGALKHAYSHAISMMRSPDSSIYRTDWNDTIHGEAFSGVFQKLWLQYRADGRTPVRIYHDMAYYASSETDPEQDRPSTFDNSGKIGRFRYKKTVEL